MGQSLLMGQRGSRTKMASGVISFVTPLPGNAPIYVISFTGLSFTPAGCMIWYKTGPQGLSVGCVAAILWNTGQPAMLYSNGYDGAANRESYPVIVLAAHVEAHLTKYTLGGATVAAAKGSLSIDVSTARFGTYIKELSNYPTSIAPVYNIPSSATTPGIIEYNYSIWGE